VEFALAADAGRGNSERNFERRRRSRGLSIAKLPEFKGKTIVAILPDSGRNAISAQFLLRASSTRAELLSEKADQMTTLTLDRKKETGQNPASTFQGTDPAQAIRFTRAITAASVFRNVLYVFAGIAGESRNTAVEIRDQEHRHDR